MIIGKVRIRFCPSCQAGSTSERCWLCGVKCKESRIVPTNNGLPILEDEDG